MADMAIFRPLVTWVSSVPLVHCEKNEKNEKPRKLTLQTPLHLKSSKNTELLH